MFVNFFNGVEQHFDREGHATMSATVVKLTIELAKTLNCPILLARIYERTI